MPEQVKKPNTPLTAIVLYVLGLSCFILPVVFPGLQLDGGFGYMLVLYFTSGIIFLLVGFIFQSWVKSRSAAAHKLFLESAEKDAAPHRLGESQYNEESA